MWAEPGSDEWHELRRGKFTGYNIHELLSNGKASGAFGKPFYTLCAQKANEVVFGIDRAWDVSSWDMKRGTTQEPDAFDLFKWNKMLDFHNVQNCGFIMYNEYSGATPDGLIDDNATLQIKCPRPEKLFTLIREGIDAIDPEYLDQMQMEMLTTNRDHAYFFNYTVWQNRPLWHEIIVEENKSVQDKIINRIGEGVIQRDKFVEQLMNNKQF
jgi:hypothetical protein